MFNKFLLGVWNVGIIEKSVERLLSCESYQIRWVKHRYKDRFFADPFLHKKDDKNYYILVEEFPFYTNVGRIVLLTVDRKSMRLINRKVCIEESFHLSYPFVCGGKIIPESYRSGKVCSYSVEDGCKEKRIVCDFGLIDQTFLTYNGYEWIFATDKDNALSGLKIFYREIGSSDWLAHEKNPVKNDITNSRPGGHFFELNGSLYRPVQDSMERYGRRIRIMKVEKLTPTEFEESEVFVVSADEFPPYNKGIHTFNAEDNFIVVDGYKEYHSFIIKPLCLKLPSLMREIGEKK